MAKDPAPPIMPSASAVVGAAKAKLVKVRPSTAPHVEKGRYAVPFIGFRAQFTVARARLAEEARAARLKSSEGDALSELAASNYDTPRAATGPTAGVGLVLLTRTVVHHLPSGSLTVTAPNATNEGSLAVLLLGLHAVFNAHASSVYSSSTGTGAHVVPETALLSAPLTSTMGQMVGTLNAYKGAINDHFGRGATALQVLTGATPQPHRSADSTNLITAADAFASDPGASFTVQSASAQQSALVLGNAIKKALVAHLKLRAIAGTVLRGTRFRLEADPVAVPPVVGGEYEVTQDAYVRTGAEQAFARLRATTAGPAQNIPSFFPRTQTIKALAPLFDAAERLRLAPTILGCAGGTNGQPDRILRAAAAAAWQGSYGPTEQAIVAGTLRYPGLASCPILRDPTTGTSRFYAVDESWAQSGPWLEGLEQYLRDHWAGVGCRLAPGAVTNQVVRIEASIVLRRRADLSDTTDVTDALRAATRAYFEERPDWWLWRLAGLRAALTRAHPKILKCPEAKVLNGEGLPLTEPPQPIAGSLLTHWWFADGLELAFSAPTA